MYIQETWNLLYFQRNLYKNTFTNDKQQLRSIEIKRVFKNTIGEKWSDTYLNKFGHICFC